MPKKLRSFHPSTSVQWFVLDNFVRYRSIRSCGLTIGLGMKGRVHADDRDIRVLRRHGHDDRIVVAKDTAGKFSTCDAPFGPESRSLAGLADAPAGHSPGRHRDQYRRRKSTDPKPASPARNAIL